MDGDQEPIRPSTTISAEVLKIEGENKHVVELRRVDGSPHLFNGHVEILKEQMRRVDV